MEQARPPVERLYEDGRVYDLIYGAGGRDVEFFVGLAREIGGPVLELACGTGRYLIPWAKAGFRAVGIDLSGAMLREAAAKADQEGIGCSEPGTWKREQGNDKKVQRSRERGRGMGEPSAGEIELHEGDMRGFALEERFGMVVIAGNSFCHLKTVEDAERCLNCVRGHLAEGGVFVVDVFVPDAKLLARDSDARYAYGAYDDPADGVRVNVTYSPAYDAATQVQTVTMYYRREGEEREEEGRLELRMWYPAELEAVLRYNGFVVERRYGGHDGSAFDGRAGKQILVCRVGKSERVR